MRGTPRTWASRSSAESRGASTPLRVKNAPVHSRVLRTVHGPSGCAIVWAILKDGREGREGRGWKIEDVGWEEMRENFHFSVWGEVDAVRYLDLRGVGVR